MPSYRWGKATGQTTRRYRTGATSGSDRGFLARLDGGFSNPREQARVLNVLGGLAPEVAERFRIQGLSPQEARRHAEAEIRERCAITLLSLLDDRRVLTTAADDLAGQIEVTAVIVDVAR